MAANRPKISDLIGELKTLYTALESVQAKGYWVFSVKDLEAIAGAGPGTPLVGVLYDSGSGKENTGKNQVQAVASQGSANLVDLVFVVIVGIPYTYGVNGDTIVNITDVLDEAREAVMGYQSVNPRGWQYAGESQVESELEGMIFYGQIWVTSVINVGKFKQ
jgi:hypothetical protein